MLSSVVWSPPQWNDEKIIGEILGCDEPNLPAAVSFATVEISKEPEWSKMMFWEPAHSGTWNIWKLDVSADKRTNNLYHSIHLENQNKKIFHAPAVTSMKFRMKQ